MIRFGNKIMLEQDCSAGVGIDVYLAYSKHFNKPIYVYEEVYRPEEVNAKDLVTVDDGFSVHKRYYKFLGEIKSLGESEFYSNVFSKLCVSKKLSSLVTIKSLINPRYLLNFKILDTLSYEELFDLVESNQDDITCLEVVKLEKNKYFRVVSDEGYESIEYFNEDEWEIIKE